MCSRCWTLTRHPCPVIRYKVLRATFYDERTPPGLVEEVPLFVSFFGREGKRHCKASPRQGDHRLAGRLRGLRHMDYSRWNGAWSAMRLSAGRNADDGGGSRISTCSRRLGIGCALGPVEI